MTNEMQIVERRDAEADLAEKLELLGKAAEVRQQPLRMRVQPAVLNHETKLYVALPGVSWMFDLPTTAHVLDAKESMELFFRSMALIGGPELMKDYMQQVLATIQAEKDRAK